MKKSLYAFLILLILGLNVIPGIATSAQNGLSLHLEQVDATGFPDILVHLNAWDAAGVPLAGLSPGNFTLQEDGGAPFQPSKVQTNSDAPLSVILVLDISSSMTGQPLADAKQAASLFLDHLAAGDQAALIAFSDTINPDLQKIDPSREMDFRSDLAPMSTLIEGLKAQGDPHLYDALTKAVHLISEQPAGHRVVLLFSDGRNLPANVGDPDTPIQLAQEVKVPVFIIGLGNDIDQTYLSRLAIETGGLLELAPESSKLASLITDMVTLLKTEYELNYTSTLHADGRIHAVMVTLNRFSESASASIDFGPLSNGTATIYHTLTPAVGQQVTSIPISTPKPTAIPSIPETLPWHEYAGWIIAALVALGLSLLWTGLHRRRPQPKPEICAHCGYDLTGKPGACPQCGGTKRLLKR